MSYVLAGYGITLVAIAGYAAWVLRRGRKLTKGRDS
jgi:heme exporter protein CcmD